MTEMLPAVDARAFRWERTPAGIALIAANLEPFAEALFTTRDLRFPAGADAADYDALGAAFGLSNRDVVRVRQIHGREVVVIRPGRALAEAEADADAIVSTDPERVVAVRIADCVPILIADGQRRVAAAIHAGWRGTAAGVAGAAIAAVSALGVPASDLVAAIGPSIGPCCYQVDEAVRSAFASAHAGAASWFQDDGPGRWKLDLWRASTEQLVRAGVPRGSISVAGLCTAHHPSVCFSYRREGATAGRMAAAIRLRKP